MTIEDAIEQLNATGKWWTLQYSTFGTSRRPYYCSIRWEIAVSCSGETALEAIQAALMQFAARTASPHPVSEVRV